jgi:penicillin-binding protein 2
LVLCILGRYVGQLVKRRQLGLNIIDLFVNFVLFLEKMEENTELRIINFLVLLIIGAGFVSLLVRAFDLMVIRGDWFFTLAQENRIRQLDIVAPRGEVLDRNGRKLITNKVNYCQKEEDGCFLISRDKALLEQAVGNEVEREYLRYYPMKEVAAHITGYLGQVNEGEVISCSGSLDEELIDAKVGRGGIEEQYDCQLRGQNGWKIVEADATGKILRELGVREPVAGQTVTLSIDGWLQSVVAETMEGKTGSVVALDPYSGEVLALYSSPSFDPNSFTYERNDAQISEWLNDVKGKPFFNRAITGAYHPGSVFKMISSVAGLETGAIDRNTLVEDTGVLEVGEWKYANWYWTDYGRTDGLVDIQKAIQRSNDIFFYKLGEWTGAENLSLWADKFGVGRPLGIDLPSEAGGILPSPEWKEKTKGEAWFLGNTYHYAIGQGDLTMTPLQVAAETAVFANGGQLCRPYLNLESEKSCSEVGVDNKYIEMVKSGMIKACEAGGTGFTFFDFPPKVGCKTGTAEVGDGSNDSHAWFTLYAPVDNPKIVLTVFLERGGSGSSDAGPIARIIIDKYFNLQPKVDIKEMHGEGE